MPHREHRSPWLKVYEHSPWPVCQVIALPECDAILGWSACNAHRSLEDPGYLGMDRLGRFNMILNSG